MASNGFVFIANWLIFDFLSVIFILFVSLWVIDCFETKRLTISRPDIYRLTMFIIAIMSSEVWRWVVFLVCTLLWKWWAILPRSVNPLLLGSRAATGTEYNIYVHDWYLQIINVDSIIHLVNFCITALRIVPCCRASRHAFRTHLAFRTTSIFTNFQACKVVICMTKFSIIFRT